MRAQNLSCNPHLSQPRSAPPLPSPGWYGHDCSRKVAGQPLEPSRIPSMSWLACTVTEPPAAKEPPPAPTRKRPLIYVYDLEPLYSQRLLQYRCGAAGACGSTGVGGMARGEGRAVLWYRYLCEMPGGRGGGRQICGAGRGCWDV